MLRSFVGISFTIISIIITSASCVPNRKITMLQGPRPDESPKLYSKREISTNYQTAINTYLLREGDLLDVKISTMTPAEFNPFIDADRTIVPGSGYQQSGQFVSPQGYYVSSEGSLELPLLGKIHVMGLTMEQAEQIIADSVRKYLDGPVVRLKLLNFRVTVLGEVNNESTVLATENRFSLLQALASAGGASEFGDLSRVKIVRTNDGETMVFYANLLTEDFLASPFYYLEPNDVIIVPPLGQRPYLKYVSPNLSIFATAISLLVAVFTLFKIR